MGTGWPTSGRSRYSRKLRRMKCPAKLTPGMRCGLLPVRPVRCFTLGLRFYVLGADLNAMEAGFPSIKLGHVPIKACHRLYHTPHLAWRARGSLLRVPLTAIRTATRTCGNSRQGNQLALCTARKWKRSICSDPCHYLRYLDAIKTI